jgi:hypothetical protein
MQLADAYILVDSPNEASLITQIFTVRLLRLKHNVASRDSRLYGGADDFSHYYGVWDDPTYHRVLPAQGHSVSHRRRKSV